MRAISPPRARARIQGSSLAATSPAMRRLTSPVGMNRVVERAPVTGWVAAMAPDRGNRVDCSRPQPPGPKRMTPAVVPRFDLVGRAPSRECGRCCSGGARRGPGAPLPAGASIRRTRSSRPRNSSGAQPRGPDPALAVLFLSRTGRGKPTACHSMRPIRLQRRGGDRQLRPAGPRTAAGSLMPPQDAPSFQPK